MTVGAARGHRGFDWLDLVAVAYVALPVMLFLAGWLRWFVALPVAVLLLAGCHDLRPGAAIRGPWNAVSAGRVWIVVLAVAIAWSALGGAGHLFYANFDWRLRDTVLRDLVVGQWPVGYGLRDGADLMLRAPVGYYLPAALVGKIFGPSWADPALLVWTALGTALFLGLAVSNGTSWRSVLVTLVVLVIFSGMDLVGTVLRGGWALAANLKPTDHLEWWAERFQYSSHTTQLFWVPNHALAGWIATALLVRHADRPEFARILPLLVALVPIWSPLTAIGFLPIAGVWWLRQVHAEGLRLVDPVALAASLAVVLVTAPYLVAGAGNIRSGLTSGMGGSLLFFVPHYLQFFLLEAGVLWMLLLAIRADVLLVTAGCLLALLPVFAFGPSNDLAMRGSIPALAVLALAAAAALGSPARALERRLFWPLVAVLALGAPTALTEITRAIAEPAWKPDQSHSLVPEPGGDYPAHYVTRRAGMMLDGIYKPVHDVNKRSVPDAGGSSTRSGGAASVGDGPR